jgi:hypothetical protein
LQGGLSLFFVGMAMLAFLVIFHGKYKRTAIEAKIKEIMAVVNFE